MIAAAISSIMRFAYIITKNTNVRTDKTKWTILISQSPQPIASPEPNILNPISNRFVKDSCPLTASLPSSSKLVTIDFAKSEPLSSR